MSCHLTDAIFETGASGVPSKSQKSFICGGVRQTITLKSPGKGAPPSTPSRGLQWLPLFWTQYIKPIHASRIGFFIFSDISSRNPFTTTWYQWRLVRTWLSSINWQNKLQKCSKLKFLKFEICKTFLNNKISTFYFWTYFLTSFVHLWNLIDMELN